MIKLKSKEDIAHIREAGRVLAETFQLLKANAKAGVTTQDLDALAYDYIVSKRKLGQMD